MLSFESSFAQTNSLRLDHLTYLTANLDSLTRYYATQGYHVEMGPHDPGAYEENIVRFPSGQYLSLKSTASSDTTDWELHSIAAFGTHVSGVTFQVQNAAELYLKFDSLGIPHSPIQPGRTNEGNLILGFGLSSPSPLDVSFESFDTNYHFQRTDSLPPNRLKRITWLLLTSSPKEEALLRSVFTALDLQHYHEGCCDFWLIGPPEDRIGVRFELSTTTFEAEGDWLSIEDGGVVTNY